MTIVEFLTSDLPVVRDAVPPEKALGPEEAKRYRNRWLFTPATVLTAVDAETGVVLIRTKDMEVHRQVSHLR